MRRILPFALLALLALLAGCAPKSETPAHEASPAMQPAVARPVDRIRNHAWIRADESGLPGQTRIFLEDGTLMIDSCWETYRLCAWNALSDSMVAWDEDGVPIEASVLEVSDSTMVLRTHLRGGYADAHYRLASLPYTCPEMKR